MNVVTVYPKVRFGKWTKAPCRNL